MPTLDPVDLDPAQTHPDRTAPARTAPARTDQARTDQARTDPVAAADGRRACAPRIGLVLGAGGTVGAAYNAGVLFSLQHHTGWDPREAASVVGTSAGSLVGALLRAGVGTEELVRLARRDTGVHLPPHLHGLQRASVADVPSALSVLAGIRPPTPRSVVRSVRHRSVWPWLLSMSRAARFDLQPLLTELDRLCGDTWPSADLRICAADAATGTRRVLDGSTGVPLSRAVAASCAVPGVFRGQRVGREHLVDGGVWSVTNVDALDLTAIDEVWVIAPMAGATFRRPPTTVLQWRIRSTLAREIARVPSGMPVRLFRPGRESSEVMGIDLMSQDRTASTILAGFLDAGAPVPQT